ncbi:hypothetical protein EJV47_20740 [Hymenobacter gummosus]|uniref:Restriction endonuclease n=1 Tax=Hymenobacter gummosus TaxID=1776032 RepID=A0A3S0QFN7_9BACT|nr:hypothetical protein [Hymenobacter gummosus]RTQ46804.1 hypothetical protein EJV47_20740 [Hymenobacter gummosus]
MIATTTPLDLLTEVIETSYRLLAQKLANGGVKARNEAALQHEFGHILRTIGELYEFSSAHRFQLEFESYLELTAPTIKSTTTRARVDLVLDYSTPSGSARAAIELKFFKKANHREPNNRYDVFKDLSNLEQYRQHGIDQCYFVLVTDHAHYVHQSAYSPDTAGFDFRHGSSYAAATELVYATTVPYGPPVRLQQSYQFAWDSIDDLYFLKVSV